MLGFKSTNLLNFCWVSIFFYILNANISLTVAQNPKNHIIFWKSVMRTLKPIHVNWFNRLRFLAEVSTKLQKIDFFGQFQGCASYIFASLFCKSKREHLWNKEKCFFFHFKDLFVLEIIKFWLFKYSNVMTSSNM